MSGPDKTRDGTYFLGLIMVVCGLAYSEGPSWACVAAGGILLARAFFSWR